MTKKTQEWTPARRARLSRTMKRLAQERKAAKNAKDVQEILNLPIEVITNQSAAPPSRDVESLAALIIAVWRKL